MKKAGCIVLVALLATVSGCHRNRVRADYFVGPSGTSSIAISCRILRDCYYEAGAHCPQGYDLVDRSEERERTVGAVFNNIAVASRRSEKVLFVSCH